MSDWGPADWYVVVGAAIGLFSLFVSLLWALPDAWHDLRSSMTRLPTSDPRNRLPYHPPDDRLPLLSPEDPGPDPSPTGGPEAG